MEEDVYEMVKLPSILVDANLDGREHFAHNEVQFILNNYNGALLTTYHFMFLQLS